MLPKLTELVDLLTIEGHEGLQNRQDFNRRPHYYLSDGAPYHLSAEDRAAFLTFNPNQMILRVRDVMLANPAQYSDQDWVLFFNWITRFKNFFDYWQNSPEDPYDDPLACVNAKPLYMIPAPHVFSAAPTAKNGAGENVVFIAAEGIMDAFEISFEPKSPGPAVPATSTAVAADSTFRCNHITATAPLTAGEKYVVLVKNLKLPGPAILSPKLEITAL